MKQSLTKEIAAVIYIAGQEFARTRDKLQHNLSDSGGCSRIWGYCWPGIAKNEDFLMA